VAPGPPCLPHLSAMAAAGPPAAVLALPQGESLG